MRRFLFILFLCAHWIARGQTLYEYRYWFDGDETTLQTGTATGQTWQMDLDVSSLAETFHLLHFQVKDTADVWSSPQTRCFVRVPVKGKVVLSYWFDNFIDKKQTISSTNGLAEIDASALMDGMHLLHVMAYEEGSSRGGIIVKTALFLKQPIPKQCKYRLWVDEDKSTMQEGLYTGQPVELNVENISEGFHLLHAQMEGATASSPLTSMFIKVPQVIGVEYLTTLFLVDGKEYKQEKLPTEGGVVKWTFDASGISHGIHKAQAIIVTPSGAASGMKETFFYRAMTTAEKNNMRCFYSVDGSPHKYEAGKMENNLYHFDLNMSDIPDGFHRLSYMLMGENGTSSKVMSTFFIKTPIGGNGVMQYDYWLNENEENMKKVKLEKRENPFKLISLLPVESCPIRSTSFHFEPENGNPVLYAKNDFHVRFYDAAGRVTEASKSYVDYAVSQPVEDIEPITDAEGIINCDRPEENGILWFKTEAKIGDSLAIKTNLAASLQIFSPSGKEVYAANGAESVKFSGCHAYEDGTYYIALHDIAATSGTTIDLHYQHIDKYAVLKWSPTEVGAASGYMHIDLFGNGYDKLKSIILIYDDDEIKADTVLTEGQSLATAEFFIHGSNMAGHMYDMVLEFDDNGVKESLTIAGAVKMVEPIYGDIEISITSQRRTAKPYPVTIEVINTGNIAYQMIPLFIAYDNPELITEVRGLNFSIDVPEGSATVDTTAFFLTNNLLNKGIKGRVLSTIIPNLNANDTIRLQVGFVGGAHTKFNMYAWYYKPWSTNMTDGDVSFSAISAKSARVRSRLCELDPCEIAQIVAPQWKECICGIGWGNLSMIGAIQTAIMNNTYRKRDSYYSQMAGNSYVSPYRIVQLPTPGSIIRNVISRCTGIPKEALIALENAINGGAMDDCPDPDPDPIEILLPGDPNDIKGYTSPSGSKYIPKNMRDAYYAIEFENDPEIANAAAHHIIIKDTLDSRYFDLSSFAPTGVKFGKKGIMLDGEQSFVRTIDLRPATNVIAQLSLDYDAKKGIATWDFLALDPMSMEPTDHAMMGILPVNNEDGDGQGEVTFNINLKENLGDGVEINNRAAIIFDQEEPIITPTWTNVMDTIAPVSQIAVCEAVNDSTMTLHFKGTDNRSGVWKYDLYRQDGTDAPWIVTAENITDSVYTFKGYTGLSYGFCVMATDSAGNKEVKDLIREATQITYKKGDANSDGVVNTTDAMLAIDKYLGNPVYLNSPATDVNDDGIINTADAMLIQDIYLTTASKAKKIVLRRRLKTTKQ